MTVLFERCMIACALYEEFWLKYVNWLIRAEPKMADGEEKIRDVYKRACQNHLPGMNLHKSDTVNIEEKFSV